MPHHHNGSLRIVQVNIRKNEHENYQNKKNEMKENVKMDNLFL